MRHGIPTKVLKIGTHLGTMVVGTLVGHELEAEGYIPDHNPEHPGHEIEGGMAGHTMGTVAGEYIEPLPASIIRATGIRKPSLLTQLEEVEQWAII